MSDETIAEILPREQEQEPKPKRQPRGKGGIVKLVGDIHEFDRNKTDGSIIPNALNGRRAMKILEGRRFESLVYDEFSDRKLIQWPQEEPRPWRDDDTVRFQMLMQGYVAMPRIARGTVEDVADYVARENPVNVVRDWLDSLSWDNTRRLSTMMPRGFGTSGDRYHTRTGRNWLISMVARAFKPGSQVDTVTVLEGPQGALKSSALRVLGGEWYKELTADMRSKDFQQQIRGVWLGEFAELATVRRAEDVNQLKQFITAISDHYRPSYGRNEVDYPRRVVFCGTTNERAYIHDSSGGRRFIPVTVGRIDLDWLNANREQLFAEAVALYKAGRKWWVWPADATREIQEARQFADPWEDRIAAFLQGRTEINSVSAMLEDALSISAGHQTQAQLIRAGNTLSKLGCKKQSRRRLNGRLITPWIVPAHFAAMPTVCHLASFPAAQPKPAWEGLL